MTAKKLVNIIAPEHDRTSCDDKKLYNTFYFDSVTGEQERSRCIRCSLLHILELNGDMPENFDFNKVIYG